MTDAGRPVLLEFPDTVGCHAVKADGTPADLLVLSLASDDEDMPPATVREWVERAPAPPRAPASQTITLQGAHIVWGAGRAAVVARPERLAPVRDALIEVSYYEAELRHVERELGSRWAHLEADAPLAFEFEERSVKRRQELAQRFRQVLALRARLSRITPHVMCPHVHPPTLASQVGERVRERTRMPQRLEFLAGQLEVFERVYDSCGQRASEFMLARRSHLLEWIIIVLLLTQTLFVGFELMSAAGK